MQSLGYKFPKALNKVQIGTVRRQIEKIDPKCFCVLLNEFAPLVLGIIKKQIDGKTCILVSKLVNQFNNLRCGDVGIIGYC